MEFTYKAEINFPGLDDPKDANLKTLLHHIIEYERPRINSAISKEVAKIIEEYKSSPEILKHLNNHSLITEKE